MGIKKENALFLESITFFGNDFLVPINKITSITFSCEENGYKINIKGGEFFEIEEHFCRDEKKKANNRYKMIKKIVRAE